MSDQPQDFDRTREATAVMAAAADLRVAVAHEWIDSPGGAENVVREILQVFPKAELWSLWALNPAREQMGAEVHTSWLARTPLAGHKALALPLMPLAWRTLGRCDYDAVITSSYAWAHTAHFRDSHAPTLHYIHTPARYWWTPEVDDRGASALAALPRWGLRRLDHRLARRHRFLATNSRATRARIQEFWGHDATVIYPPVDLEYFVPGTTESPLPFADYVLGVSRWISYKRLDLVISTAEAAGLPAVIAGSGPLEPELRAQAAAARVPVLIERQPSRRRLRDLYRGAAALVFPAHEDFGIVPVEAMGCGTPVVGPAVGGLLETVQRGVGGVLVERATPFELARAVLAVDTLGPEVSASVQKFTAAQFRHSFAKWALAVL